MMKFSPFFTAAALLLSDAALAFHLPAIIEPRQQPPKCSLYSGFQDSPSFTSFCKQLPRATKDAAASAQGFVPGSTKRIPSISTQLFTFDGGATSTMSPVNPAVSSAAAGSTFEMQNYTVTASGAPAMTSSKPMPSDVEVNCYLNGSKVPMSQCTRTQSLTHHHGYTYTQKTTSSSKPNSSSKASTSSKTTASTSKASSSAAVSPAVDITSSTPASRASVASSGMLLSTNCTKTMCLTHRHGYTYPDTFSYGTAAKTSTTKLSSSSAVANSTKPASSAAMTTSSKSSSSVSKSSSAKITSSRSTLSTSYTNSYDCNNITNAEPYRVPSSGSGRPYLSSVSKAASPSLSTSSSSKPTPSKPTSTSSRASSSTSQITSSPKPVVPMNRMEW